MKELFLVHGMSYSRVAAAIGRSVGSVASVCQSNRWLRPRGVRFTAEEDARVRELWTAGMPLRKIARTIGRPPGSVSGRLDRLGLLCQGKKRDEVPITRGVPSLPRLKFLEGA